MKEYWSIPHVAEKHLGREFVGFRKYDGSNLRFEWGRKRGYYKFGTRRRLFDRSDGCYGPAIPMFLERIGGAVESAVLAGWPKAEGFVAYCEWYGPHTFAGQHDRAWLRVDANEPMQLRLLDVAVHRQSILSPAKYLDLFGPQPWAAEVVARGTLTGEVVESVRAGSLVDGEGVVFKGGEGHSLWMAKAKTESYLKRLREVFGQEWQQYL